MAARLVLTNLRGAIALPILANPKECIMTRRLGITLGAITLITAPLMAAGPAAAGNNGGILLTLTSAERKRR
jgi:hypothetical protein